VVLLAIVLPVVHAIVEIVPDTVVNDEVIFG
jgi:hypothetical protein